MINETQSASIKKVMIYEITDGVYVFLYDTDKDTFEYADY